MVYAYPVTLSRDRNGTTIAESVDVPGAVTAGNTPEQALGRLPDALIVMLAACMEQRKPLPLPSRPRRGQATAPLPPMVAGKLALYEAMRQQRLSQTQLAARLRCDPKQIRRLLDLDHASRLEQLDTALRAVGKRLIVEVQDAA
jgi:antitoxin HicB